MKSTKAMKNIRLFKNAANGRPKRVTTGVDDYGNRFHVVNGKVKHSRSLSENKKAAMKIGFTVAQRTVSNTHYVSARRRGKLALKATSKLEKDRLSVKQDYHNARGDSGFGNLAGRNRNKQQASLLAAKIHGVKRKPKDFTK